LLSNSTLICEEVSGHPNTSAASNNINLTLQSLERRLAKQAYLKVHLNWRKLGWKKYSNQQFVCSSRKEDLTAKYYRRKTTHLEVANTQRILHSISQTAYKIAYK
jgi:hypothetical protein